MLNPSESVLSVGRLVRRARSCGLSIELSDDFGRFREVNAEAQRGALTPVLDVQFATIEDGFWLEGRDRQGALAHLQAARLVDLAGGSLQDHLHEHLDLYRSRGLGIDPRRSDARSCPSTAAMFGQVCYHGEVWIDHRWRGAGLGPSLIRLMMVLALLRWQPDYFIGLSIPKTSNPAFARKMGYAHFAPAAVGWRDASGDLVRDEGLVWSELPDLRALARQEGISEMPGDRGEASQPATVRQ